MAASSSEWPVHPLWLPPEGKQSTELDVVLFHGLQLTSKDSSDAWSSTWTQRGHDDVCWPEKWLPSDLGNAVRIFSVSYNAHAVTSPYEHVSEIAENLIPTLINRRYEWCHPIVLIGHSFGGLVLKSLIVKLKRRVAIENATDSLSKATVQRAKVFLSNLKGVAFYAVPHSGSINIATYVNKLLRCNNEHHCGIMDNIQPWQRDMEELSLEFDGIVTEYKVIVYAFCEGRPMEQVGILVDFGSAQRSARYNYYMVEDANHIEVCKPTSKQHPSYYLLLQLINTCQEVARERDQLVHQFHDLPSMFGIESYVERVETLVTSEGSAAAPRYVGVCGMGGVGKTLLLKRVHGSPNVYGHLEGAKFIWLTVGQTPDIMALYHTLSKELGLKPELYLNPEDYKLKLYNQFIRKRVFLVLDDVWKDEAFDSLDFAKGKGSVTLLSTRDRSLLERASPQISQVQMTPLSEEDSWSLFCVHAFREPCNVPGELEVLAQSVAGECQGLPLALKVIGRSMFGKTSPELQWQPVLKKLRQSRMQERTVKKQLYERLKLGYDVLSEDDGRLKDCFLSFAAYPEDHEFSFTDIFYYWLGEGWVPGNGEDDARADALSLVQKLCERSLIESIELPEADVISDEYFLAFKIHDVMRDVAFYVLQNDSSLRPGELFNLYRAGQNLKKIPQELEVTLERPSKLRRLSLYGNKLEDLPPNWYAPELMSLLLGDNPIQFGTVSFLSNFPKLRILDLRYGKFNSLPEQLGDLENLVYLDLTECLNLEIIPDTVRKLRKLKCLVLWRCNKLKYLPSGVVGLTSLQVLDTTLCDNLTWLEHIPSGMPGAKFLHPGASLEDICELVALTELRISQVVKMPHNISALKNLKTLDLILARMPANMQNWCINLQQLLLSVPDLKYLPISFTSCGGFPALIRFQLFAKRLVKFPEVQEGGLSKLRILQFCNCDSLETLPLSLKLLTSLKNLILEDCPETLENFCMQNWEKAAIWRPPILTCIC